MARPAATPDGTQVIEATQRPTPHPALGRQVVGGFFLVTGGVHLGIVAADTEFYRHFADAALFDFVRDGWEQVFMAQPALWGLLLMAGEVTLGVLLLTGGRAARWGWAGVIGFHVLLMLFGVGFWLWCLPALALLVVLARRDHGPPAAGTMAPDRWGPLGRRWRHRSTLLSRSAHDHPARPRRQHRGGLRRLRVRRARPRLGR